MCGAVRGSGIKPTHPLPVSVRMRLENVACVVKPSDIVLPGESPMGRRCPALAEHVPFDSYRPTATEHARVGVLATRAFRLWWRSQILPIVV